MEHQDYMPESNVDELFKDVDCTAVDFQAMEKDLEKELMKIESVGKLTNEEKPQIFPLLL